MNATGTITITMREVDRLNDTDSVIANVACWPVTVLLDRLVPTLFGRWGERKVSDGSHGPSDIRATAVRRRLFGHAGQSRQHLHFCDPRDALQMKYEMLRRASIEKASACLGAGF
ncbi:hypothetical protein ACV229_30595 [Burkholderia sp. MR1-5-21]